MPTWTWIIIGFFGAFFVSLLLVPVCRKLAFALNIVDHPAERKVHKKVMPLLGGLAVFLSFMIISVGGVIVVFSFDAFPVFQDLFPGLFFMRRGFFLVMEKFRWYLRVRSQEQKMVVVFPCIFTIRTVVE